MASSDSKVVYYKDVLSGQTVLSSKDEIKEVGKVFWEVKAKRKTIGSAWEGDAEFDLAKEFDLKSVGEVRQATLQSYLNFFGNVRDFLANKQGADAEKLRIFGEETNAQFEKLAMRYDEERARSEFWTTTSLSGREGSYILSSYPDLVDSPTEHEATFLFLKDALIAKPDGEE